MDLEKALLHLYRAPRIPRNRWQQDKDSCSKGEGKEGVLLSPPYEVARACEDTQDNSAKRALRIDRETVNNGRCQTIARNLAQEKPDCRRSSYIIVSDTTQKRECLHVAARTFPFVARQRGKEESWIHGGEVVPCVEGGGKTTFVFATTTAARI